MSRASMLAATAGLPRSPLYGIASCRVGTENREFEIGWDEFDRDTDWATKVLAAAGLTAGDFVIISTPNWENPWSSPVIHGLRRLKVVYMPVENYGWDARRFAHFAGVLAPKAVIGLGGETLDGLAQLEVDAARCLADPRVVWARPDAFARASEIGAATQPYVLLGPALALGIPGVGTVVNSAEWTVTAVDGELFVSTTGDRATTFIDVATGIRGHVGASTDLGVLVELEL